MPETIAVSDRSLLEFLITTDSEIQDMQNVNGQVKVFFVNDEKFKKAKINYLSDNSFSKFQMARKKVEEIIRTTK